MERSKTSRRKVYFLACLICVVLLSLFSTSVSWSSGDKDTRPQLKAGGKSENKKQDDSRSLFGALANRGRKSTIQKEPTLTTDKDTYLTGETIVFSGEDWAPGEAVTVVITRGEGDDRITLQATADDAGAFTVTTAMPNVRGENKESSKSERPGAEREREREGAASASSVAVVFLATATGGTSGKTAKAEFSGGDPATDAERLIDQETFWIHRLTYPTGDFSPSWLREAAAQDARVERGAPAGRKVKGGKLKTLSVSGFTSLGPKPLRMTGCSGCFNYTTTEGRVNTIVIDPISTNVAYSGSVGGGVWKTTNCCGAATTWTAVTDDPLLTTTSIDTIALDPNNHNIVYAGTGDLNYGSFSMGSQGIFKSTDGGANWTVLGANIFGAALPQPVGQFPQYQAVGKVRVDPNNSNNVVAGTKTGLYFSYDGGANWTGPCITNSFPTQRQDITALELTNMGGGITRILAAVGVRGFATTVQFNLNLNGANGIYSATMPASGCPGFTSIASNANGFVFGTSVTGSAYPTGANMNAASGNQYVSATSGNQLGRIELAVAPSNPNVLYAQVQSIAPNSNSGCGNANGCQIGVWASTNGGTSWSFMTGSAGGSLRDCQNGQGDYPQNWYDQALAVDPNNPDRLFVSTFDVWFATRTGTTFNNITCGYSFSGSAGPVHVDQHAIAFVPGSSSIMVIGNDGGVHGTTNANAATNSADPTWFNMDTGLNTIEFYSGDISGNFATAANPQANGGAQDNGSMSVTFSGFPTGPVQWQMGRGGDGFYARIDPVGTGTNLRMWQGNNSGSLGRCISNCTASGATWTAKTGAWTSDTQSFILPYDLFHGGVPGGDDCALAGASGGCGNLVAGTTRVWETITGNAANAGGTVTWYVTNSPATQNLTKGTLGNRSFINQVKYSPKFKSVAIVGTNDGNVWIGRNLGTGVAGQGLWTNVTSGNAILPNRPVLGIALDPTVPAANVPIGYAAVGGFNVNTPSTPGHVFRLVCAANCTTSTWTDKSGNLPDIPVDSIIVNPNFPQQVFAGTDFGLYYTDDITALAPTWQRFTNGLPNVMIWDMQIDRGSTTLSVWTRSRGAYVWPLTLGPINALPTLMAVNSATGNYGGTVDLQATLTSGGNGVAGRMVSFTLNGNSVGTAPTDSNGVATLLGASLTGINGGSYPTGVQASFVGDSIYQTNSATNSLTVLQAPTLSCPASFAVSADAGACATTVSFMGAHEATAVGYPMPTITYSPDSGSFPVGTTTVTVMATNSQGSDSCTFSVTVNDIEKPTVTAPAGMITSNDTGQCSAVLEPGMATPFDNCPGATVNGVRSDSMSLNSPYPVGTTTITWTATDAHGNVSATPGIQTITVNDTETPTVAAPLNLVAGNNPGDCFATVNPGIATASDNCPGATVNGVRSDSMSLNSPYPVGTTTITWTATDAHGNVSATPGIQTITVNDTETPTVSAPLSIVAGNNPGDCFAIVNPGIATASDNCPGATVNGVRSDSMSLNSPYPVGTTTISWTATDAHGNVSASPGIQTITVNDTEKPTVSAPLSLVAGNNPGDCFAIVNPGIATASDNCPGATVNGVRSDSMSLNSPYPVGTTTITWTATDAHGNVSVTSGIQTITVNDTEKPTVSAPLSIVAGNNPNECFATVNPGLATASDNCPGATVNGVRSDAMALNAPYPVGTTTIAWTATDAHGNTSATAAIQTITVNDTQLPSVTPISVTAALLWPPNHDLINVGLSGGNFSDNCPGTTRQIMIFGNEDDETDLGDGNFSPDARNIDIGLLRLRSERIGGGTGRIYLIVVKVTDAAGNSSVTCATVVVPRSNSKGDLTSVNDQAAAAQAYALSHNGSPPAGYFVIGDGAVVGPKQ